MFSRNERVVKESLLITTIGATAEPIGFGALPISDGEYITKTSSAGAMPDSNHKHKIGVTRWPSLILLVYFIRILFSPNIVTIKIAYLTERTFIPVSLWALVEFGQGKKFLAFCATLQALLTKALIFGFLRVWKALGAVALCVEYVPAIGACSQGHSISLSLKSRFVAASGGARNHFSGATLDATYIISRIADIAYYNSLTGVMA